MGTLDIETGHHDPVATLRKLRLGVRLTLGCLTDGERPEGVSAAKQILEGMAELTDQALSQAERDLAEARN